jgi:hypothetical protein
MILNASQRGRGQDLATHLMKTENEHVLVHELRGFAADDLHGAFKEAEAISRGTKCRQYLFSVSLSPPEHEKVAPKIFEGAIERIEERLGLGRASPRCGVARKGRPPSCALRLVPHRCRDHDGPPACVLQDQAEGHLPRPLSGARLADAARAGQCRRAQSDKLHA